MKELLTVKDLQKYLGISRYKAYELVNMPDFPALRIGKSIRIREDLLNDWILKNTNKGEEYKW